MSNHNSEPRQALRTRDDPAHVREGELRKPKKRKKFSVLSSAEKDALLCEIATRLGLVEKE